MQFDIITIFPKTLEAIFSESILAKAQDKGLIQVKIHDLRRWTTDERKTIDDKPFGGGPGMLMMVEPIYKALKELGAYPHSASTKVILTSAAGNTWNQQMAQEYSQTLDRVVLIAGHYEGVDHRVSEHLVDAEISIGNYVLTGGELPAAIITDSIARLLPGVLGNQDSLREESHSMPSDNTDNRMRNTEYYQYTRPATFTTDEGEAWSVPDVLLSGNHQQIKQWRQATSSRRT